MTAAELRAWIKSRRLSHQEAADLLAMSVDGFRKNLYGRHPIGTQTIKIIELYDKLEKLIKRTNQLMRY